MSPPVAANIASALVSMASERPDALAIGPSIVRWTGQALEIDIVEGNMPLLLSLQCLLLQCFIYYGN